MIEFESSQKYVDEIIEQFEEYKNNKNLTKKEAGLAIYMKVEIMGQFQIISQDDWVMLHKKTEKVFDLDTYEMEQLIF